MHAHSHLEAGCIISQIQKNILAVNQLVELEDATLGESAHDKCVIFLGFWKARNRDYKDVGRGGFRIS